MQGIKTVVIWRAAQKLYVWIRILIPGLVKPEDDRGQICAGFHMFIVGDSIRNIHREQEASGSLQVVNKFIFLTFSARLEMF